MNKDFNYIAKVEKAIREKYGEEAIKNPKSGWTTDKEKEYLKQRKKATRKEKSKPKKELYEDVYLIGEDKKKETRTCPVCNTYSFAIIDDMYMNKYSACFKCYVKYIEGRERRRRRRQG